VVFGDMFIVRGGLRGAEADVEFCADASDEIEVGDGLEDFDGFAAGGTVFEANSRTCSNILEVSGVTGGFDASFEGDVAGDFVSDFADGGLGVAGGFEAVCAGGVVDFDGVAGFGAFFVAIGAVLVGFSAAFVDFALVVDFFVSGRSISIGSEMTFLGLPLFLTASADMLYTKIVPWKAFD